jgi:hypothetical protein
VKPEFKGGFTREDDLMVGLGWPVTASVQSAASVDDLSGVLQQEWKLALSANLGLSFSAAIRPTCRPRLRTVATPSGRGLGISIM